MSISFHCESCKKKIKAPDNAGGKWGNCPYCDHRCYIPMPKDESEPELTLQPLDENEETRIHELLQETFDITQNILHQDLPLDEPDTGGGSRTANEKEVIKHCIFYLRQMADGELKAAEQRLKQLKKEKKIALRLLASMARADHPEPELADLPPKILEGLIRDVEIKLS